MLLLIVILILVFGLPTFGSYYGGGSYRGAGFGLGGVVLLILLVLLLTHSTYLRF